MSAVLAAVLVSAAVLGVGLLIATTIAWILVSVLERWWPW